jgi:hypothetical protein
MRFFNIFKIKGKKKKILDEESTVMESTELNTFITEIKVLDKGFVKLYPDLVLGDDNLICNAARVSYGNSEKEYTVGANRGLLSYLFFLFQDVHEIDNLLYREYLDVDTILQNLRTIEYHSLFYS